MISTNRWGRTYLLSGLFLSMVFTSQFSHAAAQVVGTCKSGTQYTTIQNAVNAASVAGPTSIFVCPGVYPEQVTIAKNKLSLTSYTSAGSNAVIIVPPSGGLVQNATDNFGNPVAAQILVEGVSSVTLSDLVVDGTGNNVTPASGLTLEGVYFQNSTGELIYSTVRNQYLTDFTDYGSYQNGFGVNIESATNQAVTIIYDTIAAYQKNGITATGSGTGPGSTGPVMKIYGNYVIGLGATSMNWTTPGAAENGIQIGYGASGIVTENTVNDNIWSPDANTDITDAASGILVIASPGLTISHNFVNSAQFGIVTETDPTYGAADSTTITANQITGTQIFDSIDACSSSNTITSNRIYGSTESAIHLDDSCGSGSNNKATSNILSAGCAGVLLGTGTGNTFSPNTYYNMDNTTVAGDSCTPPVLGPVSSVSVKAHKKLHPAPYNPRRRVGGK